MTTERARLWAVLTMATLLGSAVLVAVSCAGSNSVRHGDTIDVSGYPRDIQDAYAVFAVRCSHCHTLARPLNARIHDPQHWVRYVTRMRRNPSSGINTKDAEIILRFLLYYMHQRAAADDEPQEATPPPNTAPASGVDEHPRARTPASSTAPNPAGPAPAVAEPVTAVPIEVPPAAPAPTVAPEMKP
jgi:hypothetical protein